MQTVEYLEDGSCTNGKIIYKKIHLLHGKQYSGFCSLVDW